MGRQPHLRGDRREPVNLVVAGTNDAIGMVEAGCDEVDEADIIAGLEVAHEAIKKKWRSSRVGRRSRQAQDGVRAEGARPGCSWTRSRPASAARLVEACNVARQARRAPTPWPRSSSRCWRRGRPPTRARKTAPRRPLCQGVRRGGEGVRPPRRSPWTRSGPTVAAWTRSGRSTATWASLLVRTAPGCSPAARPRC